MVNDLYKLLLSKKTYIEFIKDYSVWKIEDNYKNSDEVFLPASYNDSVIISNGNFYELVHYSFDYDPKTGEYDNKKYSILQTFSTPEQVWQELIKPDIEEYYGIVIEE